MGFAEAEATWTDRLRLVRNVVRQEVVARQLAEVACDGARVLDVGCGQGTQLLRLAGGGRALTGVDPSVRLLGRLTADAEALGVAVEVHCADLEGAGDAVGGAVFDLVCAHGLLMYLGDRRGALRQLADRVAPGGLLSVTFRNADALAMRPGVRGDWSAAVAAFSRSTYVNELGVDARADRLVDIDADLAAIDFSVHAWFGIRVLSDGVRSDTQAPVGVELAALLDAEDLAGRRDPYRALGSQLHVIARR